MNIGFRHNKINNIEYLTIPQFEEDGNVKCVFSTKGGGVSTGECSTLNFGFRRKDTIENILKNYDIFCSATGIDTNTLVLTNQVHDTIVKNVSEKDYGKGIYKESDLIGVDGLITNIKGPTLVSFFADCVPVFIYDKDKKVIANLHSGWRGTLNGISLAALEKMKNEYNVNPDSLLAAIGPSIGQCHFEVDRDVYDMFKEKYCDIITDVTVKRAEKYYIDLWQIIIFQLKSFGIKDNNITLANECTYCNEKTYFSFRRDKGHTGNLAGFMCLK